MSTNENKFDDILRSKFEEREFPFSEENWDAVESKLESERKRKRFLWFALVFLGGLTAGIALMLPFINKKSEVKTEMIVQNIRQPQKEKPAVEIKKEITEEKNNFAPVVSPKPASEEKLFAENKIREEKKEKRNSSPEQNLTAEMKQEKKDASIKVNDQKESFPNVPVKPIKNEEIKSEQQESKETKEKNSQTETASDFSGTVLVGMNSKTDSASEVKIKKDISYLQAIIDSMDKQIEKMVSKDSVKTKKDSSSVVLSSAPSKKDSTPQDYYSKEKPKSFFTLSAGENYVRGWYKDSIEARGWNPTAGFSYTHSVNEKFSFSLGAFYHSINNLTQSNLLFQSDSISFGTVSSITQITTKKLHYAALSLALNYTFSKNMIYLGGNYSYLLQSTNTITSYVSTDGNISYTQAPTKTNGYYKAFNSYDAGAFIGYRRKLYRNWGIAGEAYYNFMDVKKDSYFDRKYFERNKGARLMLTYDF